MVRLEQRCQNGLEMVTRVGVGFNMSFIVVIVARVALGLARNGAALL